MLRHEASSLRRILAARMTGVQAYLLYENRCYMMARPITTVLCDLDGTLIDSRRDIALAFQYALRRIVEGAPPDETAIAQHIGKPLEHMARSWGIPSRQPN